MLNKFHEKQQGMELIILEQLVPQDHLLRKIDRNIDFSFIRIKGCLAMTGVSLTSFQAKKRLICQSAKDSTLRRDWAFSLCLLIFGA